MVHKYVICNFTRYNAVTIMLFLQIQFLKKCITQSSLKFYFDHLAFKLFKYARSYTQMVPGDGRVTSSLPTEIISL